MSVDEIVAGLFLIVEIGNASKEYDDIFVKLTYWIKGNKCSSEYNIVSARRRIAIFPYQIYNIFKSDIMLLNFLLGRRDNCMVY